MKRTLTVILLAGAALGIGLGAASAQVSRTSVKIGPSSLGRILVDNSGRTLYLFERDTRTHSACVGSCAFYWPPLLTRGRPVAGRGAKPSLLGTIRRADGTTQVTYAAHPLYLYVADGRPGQVRGEGSQAFGAGWDALTSSGAKIETRESR